MREKILELIEQLKNMNEKEFLVRLERGELELEIKLTPENIKLFNKLLPSHVRLVYHDKSYWIKLGVV